MPVENRVKYEDFDRNGVRELFVSYYDPTDNLVKLLYTDGQRIDLLDSSLESDFSSYKDITENLIFFDDASVYQVITRNYNAYCQAAYTVSGNQPTSLIPKDLEITYDGTRLIGYYEDQGPTLLGFRELYAYQEDRTQKQLIELCKCPTPAVYQDGKLYQIASTEVPIDIALKNESLNNLLPQVEAEIANVHNIGAGLGDGFGTVDVNIDSSNMELQSILYHDAGYYYLNYLCGFTNDYLTDQGYQYVEMYATVAVSGEYYYIETVGGGNVSGSVDGFDILRTSTLN